MLSIATPSYFTVFLLIELVLFLLTTVLLVQPRMMFSRESKKSVSMGAYLVGLVFLSVLFCWSMLIGGLATVMSRTSGWSFF